MSDMAQPERPESLAFIFVRNSNRITACCAIHLGGQDECADDKSVAAANRAGTYVRILSTCLRVCSVEAAFIRQGRAPPGVRNRASRSEYLERHGYPKLLRGSGTGFCVVVGRLCVRRFCHTGGSWIDLWRVYGNIPAQLVEGAGPVERHVERTVHDWDRGDL